MISNTDAFVAILHGMVYSDVCISRNVLSPSYEDGYGKMKTILHPCSHLYLQNH